MAMVQDNVVATQQLVRYATGAGVRTFVFLSSLSVYGEILDPIVSEKTPVCNPDTYGTTKYLCELMLRDLAPSMRSLSIRLPGILGPGSKRNWLTGILKAAQIDSDIVFYNPEAPFNNAVHIADLTTFIGDLVDTSGWNGHDVVTIGANGCISVRRAVEVVVETVGSLSALRVGPSRRQGFIISCERACAAYGYRPMDITRMLRTFARENLVTTS
jgi:nucleoside-diphosphate-sugar epimerase